MDATPNSGHPYCFELGLASDMTWLGLPKKVSVYVSEHLYDTVRAILSLILGQTMKKLRQTEWLDSCPIRRSSP